MAALTAMLGQSRKNLPAMTDLIDHFAIARMATARLAVDFAGQARHPFHEILFLLVFLLACRLYF